MAGFRYGFHFSGDGSPFDCSACSDRDRVARNCFNFLDLDDDALVVAEYSDGVRAAIRDRGARKVVTLGDLRLYECPVSLLSDPELAALTRAVYLAESSGTLYLEGGWAGQPCWFVEAYEAFMTEKARQIEKADNG